MVSGSYPSQTHRSAWPRVRSAWPWVCPNTRVSWWLRKSRKGQQERSWQLARQCLLACQNSPFGLNSTEIIKICVTPPPKFPQPAAVALAVPTTFGENIKEHQNWLVTKVAPAGFVPRKYYSVLKITCIHTTNVTDVFWGKGYIVPSNQVHSLSDHLGRFGCTCSSHLYSLYLIINHRNNLSLL